MVRNLIAAAAFVAPLALAQSSPPMSAADKNHAIAAAEIYLRDKYVLPDLGQKLASELEQRRKSGAYDQLLDSSAFAQRLTADLQSLSHDKHLRVVFSPASSTATAPQPAASTAERRARITQSGGQINYGFRKAEVLPGNIGYVAIDGFWHLEFGGGETAIAAMAFVAQTDALIIDLRENSNGGDPEMSILISSYFFPNQVHLSDFYSRATNETRQWWTLAYVAGERYVDKPVFLLTSAKTFSAAEGFAYDLQAMKRAMVIGETTAGASHPQEEYPLTERLTIELPFARSINVITKTDWEGTGVVPDIATDAAFALDKAQLQALKFLLTQSVSARLTKERKNAIADVERRLPASLR